LEIEALETRTLPSITSAFNGVLGLTAGKEVNITKQPGGQSETTVAVNPTNPANMISGYNDISSSTGDFVQVTVDAGATWKRVAIPNVPGSIGGGDPTVVFDRTGRAVYSHLGIIGNGSFIATAASTDGGMTWVPSHVTAVASGSDDKEFLAVGPDETNLSRDRFYNTWHSSNVIFASSSLDGVNWTTPVQVQDNANDASIASIIGVGPNGEVYCTWEDFTVADHDKVMFDRSFDGGFTWGTDQVLATTNINPFDDATFGGNNSPYFIPAQPDRGIGTVAWIDVDRSGGPHNGRVYVSYADSHGVDSAVHHNDIDIFLISSDNAADPSNPATFSAPVKVNDDVGTTSQFHDQLAVDQSTGLVGLAWYDCRNDPTNNVKYQRYAAISTDGGATFKPNVKVSVGQTDAAAVFAASGDPNDHGEYGGLTYFGGTMYDTAADSSNSTGDNPDGTNEFDMYGSPVYVRSTLSQTVTATGTAAADTYYVKTDPTGTFVQIYENPPTVPPGAITPTRTYTKSALSSMTFNGGLGNDTLIIDFGNGSPYPAGGIAFNGGGGTDSIVVKRDSDFTLSDSALTLGGIGTITLSGVEQATLTGGASDNTFTLNGWSGSATLDGVSGNDRLIVNAAAGGSTISVSSTGMTTATGTINYKNFKSLAVNGGAGNDTITVLGTPAGVPLSVTTGAGTNTVAVDSNGSTAGGTIAGLRSALIVNGAGGNADLTLEDSSDVSATTVTVTDTQVGADPGDSFFATGGALTYTSLRSLTLNLGLAGNTVDVQATAAGTAVTVNTGPGNDTIAIDSNGAAAGGTVDTVASAVTVNGGAGINTLTVEDASHPTNVFATVTATQVGADPSDTIFSLGASLTYASISSLTLDLPNAPIGDTVYLSPSVSTQFFINGNGPVLPTAVGDTLYIDQANAQNANLTNSTPDTGMETFSNYQTVNFAGVENVFFLLGATFSGREFNDLNGDGSDNGGTDPGLNGDTIQLYRDVNANGKLDAADILFAGTTTATVNGVAGEYSFGAPPGQYIIHEPASAASIQTFPATTDYVVIGNRGDVLTNRDFGDFRRFTISGQAFFDHNGNGSVDIGDLGLSGWTIQLLDTSNNVLATTTTNIAGNYSFANVGPGNYRVRQVLQTGWTASTTLPADINGRSGTNVPGINFGDFQFVTISGQTYDDKNGNGTKDKTDGGLQGMTVNLIDAQSGFVLDTRTTDASGMYTFTNLVPKKYRIREMLPAGWQQTTSDPPDLDTHGLDNLTVDFGNFKLIAISGQLFNDQTGDGIKAGTDVGIPNVTFFLLNATGNVIDTQATGPNGAYKFSGVGPGMYRVSESLPAGWTLTTPAPSAITAQSQADVGGVDFGNFQNITISGQVFDDQNASGGEDPQEPILPNWTVRLLKSGVTQPVAVQTSDTSGNYAFPNLGPGTYTIQEVVPAGWTGTGVSPPPIAAMSGIDVPGVNLGNFRLIAVTGTVYEDANANGGLDQHESGQSGWAVKLFSTSGVQLASTTSAADGSYTLPNLAPGTYRVREVVQTGFTQTSVNPPDTVVNFDGAGIAHVDFGNFFNVSIAGQVFQDTNGNGRLDTGETALAGWTLQLFDAVTGNQLASQTSDAQGKYVFNNLGPGTYRVREAPQSGSSQSSAVPDDIAVHLSGVNSNGINFGNFKNIGISGEAFEDQNGDGQLGPAEQGQSGWAIQLFDAVSHRLVSQQTTGLGGGFSFTNIGPGTFFIREVAQDGWTQSSGMVAPFQTVSGTGIGNLNIGNFRFASIAGQNFLDFDGNGVKNVSETGLQGWKIFLLNAGDGKLVASAVTDAGGNYSFNSVGPGTFHVRAEPRTGWVQTSPLLPDLTPSSGSSFTGQNLGNFQLGIVAGNVFYDLNADAVANGNDVGFANAELELSNNSTHTLYGQFTDANGNYAFTNLPAGSYSIQLFPSAGGRQTTANPAAITVNSGANVTVAPFGVYLPATISGRVFDDQNGDGSDNNHADPGLNGAVVELYRDTNNNGKLDLGTDTLLSTQVASTQQGTPGIYSFNNLGPGAYVVREQPRAGTRLTFPLGAGTYAVTLAGGQNSPQHDFGVLNGPNKVFVYQAYLDILQRAPDAQALATAAALLNSGQMSPTSYARALLASTEYRTQVIEGIYNALLGRPADDAGLSFYLNMLARGGTSAQIRAAIASSPEYFAKSGGDNAGFVTALFNDLLHRQVDAGALVFYSQALAQGLSHAAIASVIANSTEAAQVMVNDDYFRYLGRDADGSGLNFFTGALAHNLLSENDVIVQLIASSEFTGH
jgi:protocatechuate 3,4-dioxygenase beta subunit